MADPQQLSRSSSYPVQPAWKRYLHRVVYAREFLLTATMLLIVVGGVGGLTYVGVAVLSSVRAYVNGEALYSKSQKDAVYYLHLYATTENLEYFAKYEGAIAVPQALGQVHFELRQPMPSLEAIRERLAVARIDPEDLPASMWAPRLFYNLQPMAGAFRFWAESDQLVRQLDGIAVQLWEHVDAGQGGGEEVAMLLQEMERVNLNLTNLEDAFSRTLGEVARWVQQIILWSVLLGALLLLVLALGPLGRMLRRLKGSEEQFRRLFEQSSDAIVLVTLEGTIAYANPAARQLFGYETDGLGKAETVRADTHFATDRARRVLSHTLQSDGAVQDYEIRLRRSDGSLLLCLVTATFIRDESQHIIGYECVIRDITERRRTQERMRLLERAVDASGNGIFISDATLSDFPLVYVNPAFERMTGYAAQDALGRALQFLHDTEGGQPIPAPLQRALRAGEPCRAVLLTSRKDGTSFWNELSLAPVFNGQDELVNYVGVQTDVTETKQAEQALVQALARQKELGELQTRFITMVSHEFRTPLATILSSAELVERFRHTWEAERTLKHLQRIQTSVRAMTDLLENVLVVGRVEAVRQFRPVSFELIAFSKEVIEDVWMAYGKEHEVFLNLPANPLFIRADPNLLRYVLNNLLTNAIKYSPPGSQIAYTLAQDDDAVIMRVADEGIGIPEDDLPHIFEPFHRAANADIAPGTGLGLSIARRAVELHGGTITVARQETGGTIFSVAIPR